MNRRLMPVLLFTLVALAVPRMACADATAFLGVLTAPNNHRTAGFAIGAGLLIVGFEFEYAGSTQDPTGGVPSLKTGSFNGLLQTPVEIARMQFYFTAGGGIFREVLGPASTTNFVANTGGGVKISIFGPIRLRVDYRVFSLSGSPLYPHPQRIYAGLNLKF